MNGSEDNQYPFILLLMFKMNQPHLNDRHDTKHCRGGHRQMHEAMKAVQSHAFELKTDKSPGDGSDASQKEAKLSHGNAVA